MVRIIAEQIGDRGGRIPFAEFMDLALYHPVHGYYSSGPERIGPGGDYYTGCNMHPLFGELIAGQTHEMWKILGTPPLYPVNAIRRCDSDTSESCVKKPTELGSPPFHPEKYFCVGSVILFLTSIILYAIIYKKMQNKKFLKLSRLRQMLRRLLQNLEGSLEVAFGRSALVKGNVYAMARKCGKDNCVCTRGQLHRSMVLSWSEGGRSRLFSIPPERLRELQEKSAQYLRFRRARARVTEICRDIVAVLDQMEGLRREEP